MSIDITTDTSTAEVVERFVECFEHRRFDQLGELYRPDAVFDLYVGDLHDQRTGPDAIVERYVADYAMPTTFSRWEARVAPWGAVVQGDALQGHGAGRARFRWAHVLTVEEGRIAADTVYCTGAVSVPA